MKPLLTLFTSISLVISAAAERVDHLGCYAEWSDAEVTVGNDLVERKWTIKDGFLTATSLRDKSSNTEWIRQPGRQPAPHPGGDPASEKRELTFTTQKGKISPVGEEGLMLKLAAAGAKDTFTYEFQVFPKSSGVMLQFTGGDASKTNEEKVISQKVDGLEQAATQKPDPKKPSQALEDLMLSPLHLRYTQVELMDQTDGHDELVFEREWLPLQDSIEVDCNVFHLEDPLSGNGLVFLKIAPLPHARPIKSDWDVRVAGEGRRVTFAGSNYPWTVITYQKGRAGRIAAMQGFQRCIRRYEPQRDGMFLSNTWGDRNRDSRISAEFLLKEVEAGAKLGVDVVQVDDGWQKGQSGNSAAGKGAWGNFRSADPEFWKPHPQRFPNGLKPLVDAAKGKGMKFGLWFGPDAEKDMAQWEADADMLLDVFNKAGVEYVKIDAVEMQSPTAEKNLNRFYNKVLEKTEGRVVFDADVTAGLRPGYFGAMQVGPIFLENRYTDWKRYWPHHTLRNLWTLSGYVDPVRLRMEFLNNARNADKYKGDPLAPANYPPDTLFASVMFSSPLAWFEVSNLPENYFQTIPDLAATWKKEREAIFSGSIIPIGQAPDGYVWTGFSSVSQDRKSARLVVFREMNTSDTWTTEIPLLESKEAKATVLGGKGTANYENGTLKVTIPETLQYLFIKVGE